jgi:CBS domain containing-hemolysin-like protein
MATDLKQYTAKDLVGNQQLKSLQADQTLADALVELSKHQLLALPIFDNTTNQYIGFIDVIDVVSTLLLAGMSIDFIKLLAPVSVSLEEFVRVAEFPFNECVIREIISKHSFVKHKFRSHARI